MRLAEGIEHFVLQKRKQGIAYSQPENALLRFSSQVGDVQLSQVTTQDVSNYLSLTVARPQTWQRKYRLLFVLFEYWTLHGAMQPILMPEKRTRTRSTFVPYVYSHAEIQLLLDGTARSQRNTQCLIDPRTFRTVLLLLYATGALVSEVVRLRKCDLNLKRRVITLSDPRARRKRSIPISEELCVFLRNYVAWRFDRSQMVVALFVTKSGRVVEPGALGKYFRRLRRVTGLRRRDGAMGWPRLLDLRVSFAVNRMTEWIRDGSNMNQMLPALAAYLGQFGLESAERYLRLTPERFCSPLASLSPSKCRKHWRDDEAVMQLVRQFESFGSR
jgi:integrase/recombinase XerD